VLQSYGQQHDFKRKGYDRKQLRQNGPREMFVRLKVDTVSKKESVFCGNDSVKINPPLSIFSIFTDVFHAVKDCQSSHKLYN
jgi:hypothetical protein